VRPVRTGASRGSRPGARRPRAAVALLLAAAAGLGALALHPGVASAAPTPSYTAKVSLDGRTVKDPQVPVGAHRVADKYPAGAKLTVVCQDSGPSYGGSAVWDLTDDGLWVPHGFVNGPAAGSPRCAVPKSYPAKVDLNGRKHKGDAADAPGVVVDRYKAGQKVPVDCQAGVAGAIWDHTIDGVWVPDEYVKTGSDGYVDGLPRCDTDELAVRDHGRTNGPAGPTGGTRAEKVARVIAAARSQTHQGYTYAWGAGGKGGPSYGIHHYPDGDPANGDDYGRHGYDCSGLTLYAFWKGAGLDIGTWTGEQYRGGTKVSLDALQPGDLIFWGRGDDSQSTTHVALYVGNNEIIEAAPPRDGNSVHVTRVYGRSGWTAHAVRYIT
jgi:hypothetical protein